jgi:Tol biopolymer transport system component
VAYAVGVSEGTAEIRVARSDGAHGVTVPAVGADQWPAWSPTSTQIAFGDGRGIDVFTTATRRIRRVTRPGRCGDLFPTWEPGGRKLAFFRDCDTGSLGGIYEVGADGREEVRILAGPHGNTTGTWPGTAVKGNPTGLSWSPDGASIALATSDGSLWLVPAKVVSNQGGSRLTESAVRLVGPEPSNTVGPYGAVSWSPDGRGIAFIRGGAIYEIDTRTRRIELVAGTEGSQPLALSWR